MCIDVFDAAAAFTREFFDVAVGKGVAHEFVCELLLFIAGATFSPGFVAFPIYAVGVGLLL